MRPCSLHQQLLVLFAERTPENLQATLNHFSFKNFIQTHALGLPVEELVLAFTHTSFSHEYEVAHQELAEFFGDAVVQLIVTAELMRRFPFEKEGRLSKLRSSIVNEKTLAQMANFLKLQEYVLVGRGEFNKQLYRQETILSDTLEALMGKIFKHEGLEKASRLFLTWLDQSVPDAFNMEILKSFDAKSKLQEATLAKYKTLPRYGAQAHGDGFKVMLWINENLVAEGVFSSKKIGEKELARMVLENKEY